MGGFECMKGKKICSNLKIIKKKGKQKVQSKMLLTDGKVFLTEANLTYTYIFIFSITHFLPSQP